MPNYSLADTHPKVSSSQVIRGHIFPAERIPRKIGEYLEAIYRLQKTSRFAKTGELARLMKVAPGTITKTVQNLERKGLAIHEPYKGVRLTDEGRRVALKIRMKKHLAERLLTDIPHMDWSKVHEKAWRLGRELPDEIIEPLERALMMTEPSLQLQMEVKHRLS